MSISYAVFCLKKKNRIDMATSQGYSNAVQPTPRTAHHGKLHSRATEADDQALPEPRFLTCAIHTEQRPSKYGAQQHVGDLADVLIPRPAVHSLRTAIQEFDGAVVSNSHDGVVRQVQELRLLPEILFGPLSFSDVAILDDDALNIRILEQVF